jgi:aspartyl/asparaginyl beta-hydroxylase (cupin superfamily)
MGGSDQDGRRTLRQSLLKASEETARGTFVENDVQRAPWETNKLESTPFVSRAPGGAERRRPGSRDWLIRPRADQRSTSGTA